MATLTQQKSLIHGLPDHLVRDEILTRASSWWDCRSIRAVSKGWRGALQLESDCPKKMFAAIHRIPSPESQSALELAVSVYDPELGSWEQLPPIPGVPCGVPMSARCICVEGKLFVLGGRALPSLEFLDSVFAMDLRAYKRRWICCAGMRQARAGFACLAWKDKIIVAGGQGGDDDRLALSSVEAYSIDRDCWNDLPELEIPRADCTGAVIENGIMCVVGGFTLLPCDHGDQQIWLNCMEVLEIGRRDCRWEIVDSGSSNRDVLQSCVISSGVLHRAPHPAAMERMLGRCERRWWTAVNGRICCPAGRPPSSSSDCEDEEEEGEDLLLMGIGEGSDEYVTRCCQIVDDHRRTSTSLCRAKIAKNKRIWEEIEMPFELLPTVSCCSITL
ncbi:hypothetical protein SELMODRAFT_447653 [Selaginella moellendorffii]|uniref:F-box domain-containing protein n=1 Tax=Selaginella moellendorffii TaxID=88036 RepID=D8T1A3_SELML|nr:F-box/kelch-repeat protein At1g80440 [Selaginella moellendorffii]EFJ09648.1 hypothetical protein SELMODRAFT_447653 [Selaginella moellendorffii]|eukprot:XP_002989374.1 F-box/kelch-repeat protein At1g80440 [Selaginella moellendorffii]